MLLLGNVGQQFDIDDVEGDVARLRSRLADHAATNQSQDQALASLQQELAEVKVIVAELARALVAGGTLPQETVERIVRALEAPAR